MNSEINEVLVYKKKVANYCIILLVFVFAFGILQAFNHNKSKIFSSETRSSAINTI